LYAPQPLGSGRGIMFISIVRPCVVVCVVPSVCDVVCAVFMVPYTLVYFHQTFVSSASWDKDVIIRFWGQKIKGQGHSMIRYVQFLWFFVRHLHCVSN